MLYVGIDISKLSFDVAFLKNDRYVNKCFDNNSKGFLSFVDWIKKKDKQLYICLEATGIYSFNLAQFLVKHKINVMVVNPIITHAFFKIELGRNKTDCADAQLISRYCEHSIIKGEYSKRAYRPKSPDYESLQRLITRCEQLEKSKTQEQNHLEASLNNDVSRSIKRLHKMINDEVKIIKKKIADIVQRNESIRQQVKLLTSIVGIGEKTAWSILAYIGDVQFFLSSKQVASYAGLTPKIFRSGTSINKSCLSKLGHKKLRKSLYMPALVAIKYNIHLKEFYERLVNNGKPKKVAIIAVMRKLLVLSYGVLKSEKEYDINYQAAA